jgi:antitoxin CptB
MNSLRHDRSDVRRRRLLFRSWHRGTQETDLILGSFAERSLADFDTAQLDRFEALLDCADVELFDWMAGRSLLPTEHDHDVMRLLRSFLYAPGPCGHLGNRTPPVPSHQIPSTNADEDA